MNHQLRGRVATGVSFVVSILSTVSLLAACGSAPEDGAVESQSDDLFSTLSRWPLPTDFTRNGSATLEGTALQLTGTDSWQAGSVFLATPIDLTRATSFTVKFDLHVGGGSGADGLALVFADANSTAPTALGSYGSGLGFAGIKGIAVAFDTFQGAGDPSGNFVGVTDGPVPAAPDQLHWLATSTSIPALRSGATFVVTVTVTSDVTVKFGGTTVLHTPNELPAKVLLGFTAANGYFTDKHQVAEVSYSVTSAPLPPPPPPDPVSCAGLADGDYCGDDRINGDPNKLYRCESGGLVGHTALERCTYGCVKFGTTTTGRMLSFCSQPFDCVTRADGNYCGGIGDKTQFVCSGGRVATSVLCASCTFGVCKAF